MRVRARNLVGMWCLSSSTAAGTATRNGWACGRPRTSIGAPAGPTPPRRWTACTSSPVRLARRWDLSPRRPSSHQTPQRHRRPRRALGRATGGELQRKPGSCLPGGSPEGQQLARRRAPDVRWAGLGYEGRAPSYGAWRKARDGWRKHPMCQVSSAPASHRFVARQRVHATQTRTWWN